MLPEVRALSLRLLEALNYRGFVAVEFKRDPRDGTYRLMEINPRTASGNQLAISAGVDFPWIGYQHLAATGPANTPPPPPFRVGVGWVSELWDLQAYLLLRRAGALSLRGWLRSVRGAEARALGAWDDPLPLLVATGGFLAGRIPGRRLPAR
jgi:predicted ATP-grasp superfamily ATP-dependent carboligase